MKVDKSEYAFSDTLRAEDIKEEKIVKILDIKQVSTKYGEKYVAVLDSEEQIFLNNLSLQNLVEAFGDETEDWIDKETTLTIETSERTRGKDTIVLIANETQRDKKAKKKK